MRACRAAYWEERNNMADGGTHSPVKKIEPSCDYNALRQCLERNGGDRTKCSEELELFQRSCEQNRRWVRAYEGHLFAVSATPTLTLRASSL